MITLRLLRRGSPPSAKGLQHLLPDTPRQSAGPSQSELPALKERLTIALGARWEVGDPLAIGGTSTVFRLRHRLHGGSFVAKVLHPALAEQPLLRKRFRDEAAHLALLSGHPGMVPILDIDEFDGLLYQLSPFIDGEDLDCLLKRLGRLSRLESLTMAAQLGSTLMFAESRGILHGDLSTGNLRLDTCGFYRLLDFGMSRKLTERDDPVSRGATPAYCSPEQLRGGALDVRSDLYSLGAVLFECLCGHSLFPASTLDEINRKRATHVWQMPPELEADRAAASILRRLLADNPNDRFQNPCSLLEALAAEGFLPPDVRRHPGRAPEPSPAGIGTQRSRLTAFD